MLDRLRSSHWFIWSMMAVLFVLVISGCGEQQSLDEKREKALRKQSDEIVIGVVWPFAKHNDQFQEGLELALEQVNETGVLGGKKIRLIERDDDNSVIKGMAIAQEFAEDLSVSAVIGHRISSVTVPASHIYDNAGIVLMAPASTSPNLTSQKSPFIFRNIPSDEQLGQELATYASDAGYRNVAIYYVDDEYGRGLANTFEEQANHLGLKVIDRLSEYKDSSDVRRIAEKWDILDGEVVLVATLAEEGLEFIRELRAAGFDKPIIGGDGLDQEQFASAGDFVEGTVIVSVYHHDHRSEPNEQFRQQFSHRFGSEPSKWAAQAYDSLLLLAHAIEEAGSRSPKAIAEQLVKLDKWEGVSGPRSFDSDGNVQDMELVIKQVNDGTLQFLSH